MSLSSYDVWKRLLDDAQVSIDIASFYWNLRDPQAHRVSWQVTSNVYFTYSDCSNALIT